MGGSRIENRIVGVEDQGSGFDTQFCPRWLSIHLVSRIRPRVNIGERPVEPVIFLSTITVR